MERIRHHLASTDDALDRVAASLHATADELARAVAQLQAVGWGPGAQRAAAIQQETLRLVETVTALRRTGGELTARAAALIDGSTSGPGPGLAPPLAPAPTPSRPAPDAITLTPDRQTHILDGDRTGGGHRHGTGREGKTEFPARWDDETTIRHILDVAQSPDHAKQQDRGSWRLSGRRDHVDIDVIVAPSGQIRSAFPRPGGDGVIDNYVRKEGTQ